jgi:hypothetical protein
VGTNSNESDIRKLLSIHDLQPEASGADALPRDKHPLISLLVEAAIFIITGEHVGSVPMYSCERSHMNVVDSPVYLGPQDAVQFWPVVHPSQS